MQSEWRLIQGTAALLWSIPSALASDFHPDSSEPVALSRYERMTPIRGDKPTEFAMSEMDLIVNGCSVKLGQARWHVALVVSTSTTNTYLCGASHLGDGWILTAAHCVESVKDSPKAVWVGSGNEAFGDLTWHKARHIKTHEEFDPSNGANDIALIRAKVSSTTTSVSLPNWELDEFTSFGQEELNVYGFGKACESCKASDALLFASVGLMKTSTCDNRNGYAGTLESESMLCANGSNAPSSITCHGNTQPSLVADSCDFDSGGSLVTTESNGSHIQLGIVSFGRSCGMASRPGVYARVSHFVEWIGQIRNPRDSSRPEVNSGQNN